MLQPMNNFTKKFSDLPGDYISRPSVDIKDYLDSQPRELRDYINNTLIPQVIAEYALKTELNNIVLGQIPGGAITDDKLSNDPGMVKAQLADKVSKSITINDKALSSNITLTSSDVGATPNNNYVANNAYAVTTGTSTAYTITLNPAPTAYSDGMQITILPHIDCGATPTLNVNGLGSLTIVKQDGTAVAAGDIKANKPLSLVRVGSNFFIRSSGGCKEANGTWSSMAVNTSYSISNLSFRPRMVIIEITGVYGGTVTKENVIWDATKISGLAFDKIIDTTFLSSSVYSINNNGFTVQTNNTGTPQTGKWYAIG